MNNQDYRIKIEADNSGAVRVIDETGNKLESLGRSGAGAAGNLGSAFDGLALRVGSFAVGAVAGFVSVQAAIEGITRGAELDEIGKAFEAVSGGAEQATINLEKLVRAADGLISKADLMKSGSQSLLAGLDASQTAELTRIATILSDPSGMGDLQALDTLINAFARGRTQMLETLGVHLDLTEANKKHAAAIGLTVEQLSEAQKAAIFKVEALEALRVKADQLATTESNLNDELDRLRTSITEARDSVAIIIADFINASGIVPVLTAEINNLTLGFRALFEGTRENQGAMLATLESELQQIESTLAGWDGGVLKGKLGRAFSDAVFGTKEEYEAKAQGLRNAIKAMQEDLAKSANDGAKANSSLTKSYEEQIAALRDQLKNMDSLNKGKEDASKLDKQRKKEIDELIKAQEREAQVAMRLAENTQAYQDVMDDLSAGVIDNAEASDRLNDVYAHSLQKTRELAAAESELARLMLLVAQGANVSGAELGAAAVKVGELKSQIDGLVASETELDGFGDALQNAFASALDKGFAMLIEGNTSSQGFADIAQSLGGDIGAAIGEDIGGPIGGAVGKALGNLAGKGVGEIIKGIGDMFGSNNAGAEARDKIDAFFEDLLDEHRLFLVIDGKLTELTKLTEEKFSDGSFAYNPFPNLSESAQSSFTNIGVAFEAMFDVMGEVSGQWGNVLANNVGGSLNNLQIMLQGLGISQEQLAEQLENLWLEGQVSAQEYLTSMNQLNDLYTQGIPGAVGATAAAFQNLIDSSGAGRQVLDALGDAAAEAGEKGIKTLEGLKADLIASGADAEKVEKLFQALAAVGVTSLEQLQSVGVTTAATIAAELEKTGDFFSDVNEELGSMEERFNKLKDKEVNLTFNVKTNIDKNTSENMDLLKSNGLGFSEGATQ